MASLLPRYAPSSWPRRSSSRLLLCLLLLLAACSSSRLYIDEQHRNWQQVTPPPDDALAYRIFLIGDAGYATADEPALLLLDTHLQQTGEHAAVVFLGDNIYCCGLPDSTSTERPVAEARLTAQLQAVDAFPGRTFFIPGNHDWNNGRPGGREAVARQEAFVETYLDRGNTFLPDDGFPGPTAVELTDEIVLIALNTEWWLSDERSFGDTGAYTLNEPSDFLLELRDLLDEYRNHHLLIVGHHPLFSNGKHGGYFSPKTHLVPLPLIGSIGPLYRRFIGKRQDLAHARYRLFRREITTLLAGRDDLIYAAGHDHNLQYISKHGRRDTQHYIVSGAASHVDYVAGGHGATFTAAKKGFVSLQYYTDNAVWMEIWTPDDEAATGRLLFRQRLKDPEPDLDDEALLASLSDGATYPDYRDSTVVTAINSAYRRTSAVSTFLLGRNHRDLWATPVEVPVLDVQRMAGGLTPLRIGGQSQSITMRLRGNDGLYYMLRSIDKEAGRAWPPELRRTLAWRMAQDQVSMLHPYGAFIIPPLADAAGIFHTNPRPVFVPEDPRLASPRNPLAGTVALFEERPDEDMSDVASVGRASNVIGSTKLFQEINDDNDHRVDARAFARARLLDMLVADWDRTPDNWRWAAFEPYELDSALEGDDRTEGKIYLPVPRDRDAAFMQVSGLLPSLYAFVVEPTWQDFDATYGDIRELNKKGLPLDRRFTPSLTRSDWVQIADSVRASLTDEVIDAAVRSWPAPIFDRAGAETINALKTRRDKLPQAAEQYYEVLARVVDVVGSHKHERFEVTRRDDATEVVVYKTSKEGEIRKKLLHRTLYRNETRELRLYGLGGNDQFIVDGMVRRGIRVIAVGGTGKDTLVDTSSVRGRGKRTRFYDTPETPATVEHETRLTLEDDPLVNRYDLYGYQYNTADPIGFFGSNTDDGIFVGGGVKLTRHGFRKNPHAATHKFIGNYAVKTNAFNLRYVGHYVSVLGRWDARLTVGVYNPNNVRNFYGLGNETTDDRADARFYQARFSQVQVTSSASRSVDRGLEVRIGPTFDYIDVREDEHRFVGRPQAGVSPNTFDRLLFSGLEAAVRVATLNDAVNPRQGFHLDARAHVNLGLKHLDDTHATLSSDLALYYSPSLSPQVTLAVRAGGAHNVGTFPFFVANTLGGTSTLRGYRNTRFAGRTSAFQNVDLRIQLVDFAGYLGYGKAGLLGFIDNGRVWTDGEHSRVWHQGYGGGVWAYLFDAYVLTGTVGLSDEDRTFTLQFGFQF